MKNKILFVDDDANILASFQRNLRKEFSVETALGGREALRLMGEHGPYAVVVADMQMPEMNGLEFLTQAGQRAPDTTRLMLTGNADQRTAVDAVNQGHVFQFLTKPCPNDELVRALNAALKQHRLVTAERELLEKTLNGAIDALVGIMSVMDPVSFGYGQRLRVYMAAYTRAAKVENAWVYEMAAMLSRIGYVAIPLRVLSAVRHGQPLRPDERDMLACVPRLGADLLTHIPRLEPVADIILYQAKLFSGSGYPPDGVSGQSIPHGARVLKVLCDLIDLETAGQSRPAAVAKLRSRNGWYDPQVLDAVIASLDSETLANESVQEIQIVDLQNGDVLVNNVETADDTLLVTAGTTVSAFLVEKLRNFDQLSGLKRPILIKRQKAPVAP